MEHGTFHDFLEERLKDKGLDRRRLSRISGISARHIEGLISEDASLLPPAPYVYGYLRKLGSLLEFDADVWWQRSKDAFETRGRDTLPATARGAPAFARVKPFAIGIAAVILGYMLFTSSRVLGKPVVRLEGSSDVPLVATERLFTLRGTVQNGDGLSVNGETVELERDGSWQKTVLLSEGLNSIEVRAKKFLGRETVIIEQIVYNATNS